MTNKIYYVGLALFFSASVFAQEAEKDKKKWDVSNPPGNFKDVSFTVNEGTWMNLDVSPNGKTIVFDLLGDIYTIPMTGGTATLLRGGLPFEVQPRFSPDGSKILFTSDAGGGDNIWTMDANGENAKQVTKESFRLLNNGVWSADGQYIIARKHFTSSRSLGAGEMWQYHVNGGSGLQLTEKKNEQQDVNEPSVSADGKYLYFSEDMYPGGYFQYNKDPNSEIFVVKKYDFEKGKVSEYISGPGGAFRPQADHKGKYLAFVRRVRTETVLMLKDIASGQEYPLFDGLSKDQQEAWTVFGIYTGYAWTPDDSAIVIWGKGKLWKVDIATKKATEIPFSATAKHRLQETVQVKRNAFDESNEIKVLRSLSTTPDGKKVVFNAVGKLWIGNLNNKPAEMINTGEGLAFEPALSPDGKQLAYVSWDDEQMGAVYVMNFPVGTPKKITQHKGIYRTPSFSPDGKRLLYVKSNGNQHQGYVWCEQPGIYMSDLSTSLNSFIQEDGEYPVFDATGKRIFFQKGGFLFGAITKSYQSVDLTGNDNKKHFEAPYGQRFSVSPDNQWVAWSELYKVYVAPFPNTGKTVGLSASTKAIPVAQVAKDAGINIHWSANSQGLMWTMGNEYFSTPLTDRFLFLKGAVDSIPPMDSLGTRVVLNLPSDKPSGIIALTNARILTMEGDEIIENGTLIIEENKIKKMGKASEVNIPAKAFVQDCTGKSIMPGIVDVHAHVGNFRYGISPQKQWEYYANLAYGVTTSHDPSSNSEMIFSQSEMIKTGAMVGPRLFSTGTILYGADGDFKAEVNSLEDAISALRRTKAYGAFSVKSYNQPRREQRQQVIEAARQLDMMVVPEGGSFFFHNLSMVADGHTGVEHNIPVAPLYSDVINFWKETKTHNTPTLIVNYGGVNGEYYWYQKQNIWEKDRLLSFTPRGVIDSRSRHRTMIPEEEYKNGYILTSESCTKLQEAGVNINLGAHGQIQGIGAHWELWMLAQGGMSPHQALRCATINGAKYIGMDSQIGSLKEGKLADIIVLDANPLENIQNTEQVKFTIINGRMYDAATMNEIGNRPKNRTSFYFEQEGSGNNYPMDRSTGTFMQQQCSCRH